MTLREAKRLKIGDKVVLLKKTLKVVANANKIYINYDAWQNELSQPTEITSIINHPTFGLVFHLNCSYGIFVTPNIVKKVG